VSFGPLDAYVKGAASAVKVNANKSHRRSSAVRSGQHRAVAVLN
jgi:hypothetical protein